jgi:hypothetical protein
MLYLVMICGNMKNMLFLTAFYSLGMRDLSVKCVVPNFSKMSFILGHYQFVDQGIFLFLTM